MPTRRLETIDPGVWICRGVGAAKTATIRYHGVENRKYNNIPLSALTSLVFGNTFGIAETKRIIIIIIIIPRLRLACSV